MNLDKACRLLFAPADDVFGGGGSGGGSGGGGGSNINIRDLMEQMKGTQRPSEDNSDSIPSSDDSHVDEEREKAMWKKKMKQVTECLYFHNQGPMGHIMMRLRGQFFISVEILLSW